MRRYMVHARLSGRAFDMICLRNEHQILQFLFQIGTVRGLICLRFVSSCFTSVADARRPAQDQLSSARLRGVHSIGSLLQCTRAKNDDAAR
jgi:hypothetical protein